MMKVKNGDLDKLGVLFERYNRRLFGFFYRLTLRNDVSEDLVQGVFERILRYRKTYSDDGDFSTWLFSIARNLHTDHYRQMKKQTIEENDAEWFLPENEHDTDMAPEEDYQKILLQRALEKLDPDKKQALILSRYQGFRYNEIAEIMKCSEGAVKVRVFRAIQELKEIVADLGKQEKL